MNPIKKWFNKKVDEEVNRILWYPVDQRLAVRSHIVAKILKNRWGNDYLATLINEKHIMDNERVTVLYHNGYIHIVVE